MNNKIRVLAIFLVLTIIGSISVSAVGNGIEVNYAGGDTAFHLRGSSDMALAGQIVTLKVTATHGTPIPDDDTIDYMRQTYTQADGSYAFDFELTVDGDAQAIVSIEGVIESPINLFKSTPLQVTEALSAVDSGVVSAVQNETHAKTLMVNPAEITSGSIIAQVIDETATSDTYYQTNGLPAFTDAYRTGKFLTEVKNAANAQAVADAMTAYADVIDISGKNAGKIFANYSDADKASVLNTVKGRVYIREDAFADAIYEAVIMKELASAYSDNEKYGVVVNNNDVLGLNLAKYEALADKFTTFKKQVFAQTVLSKAALASVFESVYAALSVQTRPSGGGTGGGGGNSSMIVTAPSETVKDDAQSGSLYFSDLSSHTWAQESIQYLASAGVVSGKGNNKFCPDDTVTRGEFIKMLVGALNITDSSATSDFADVSTEHWAYPYVSSAVKAGITNGTSNNEFSVNAQITRQDMAVMCYRALGFIKRDLSNVESVLFADEASISSYAKSAVGVLAGLGIINGKGNNQFDALSNATRAEAAKVVYLLRERG